MTTGLTDHRPTHESVTSLWGQERQTAVLAQLMVQAIDAADPARSGSRSRVSRRWVLLGGAAAAVAATVAVAEVVSAPRLSTPAQAIQRLTLMARRSTTVDIPFGMYLYQVTDSKQTARPDYARTRRTWTARDGAGWGVTEETQHGRTTREVARDEAPPHTPGTLDTSLDGMRSWPTTGTELDRFLRDRDGDAPGGAQDEGIFETIREQMWVASTPAGVRAAMFEILGTLPEAVVEEDGERTSVTFHAHVLNPGATTTLVFDNATSRLVSDTSGGWVITTVRSDIVAGVPSWVRAQAGPPVGNQDHPTG